MTEKKNRSMIQRRLIPTYIFLIIVSFLSVFPFYWMISAATNESFDVANGKITLGTHFMTNFQNLVSGNDLWGAMGNSFLYAIVQTLIAILVCSLAGFGFELYHDKYKDRLFSILLLAMMIPQVATMIPLFKLLSSVNLLNSVWGFILPSISTPFLIMMFRQNSRNFPIDVMEAARIDGLSEDPNFLPDVYADDESNLRSSGSYHIYECMELLFVAEGNYDDSGIPDYADADRQPVFRLYDRLRSADGGRSLLFCAYDDCVLRIAETVCRRYYGCRKIKYCLQREGLPFLGSPYCVTKILWISVAAPNSIFEIPEESCRLFF